MNADVDARPGDRGGQDEKQGRCPGGEERQRGGAREARGRVTGRKGAVVRHGQECLGLCVDLRWPGPADRLSKPVRDELAGEISQRHLEKDKRPAPPKGEPERDQKPDEPLPAGPGEPFEDGVEPARPMMDGPAFELPVPAQVRPAAAASRARSAAVGRRACRESPERRVPWPPQQPRRRPCR